MNALVSSEPAPLTGLGRRFVCKCGCGRWWVWPRGVNGRPRELATPDCYARRKAERQRQARRLA